MNPLKSEDSLHLLLQKLSEPMGNLMAVNDI